jgi:hypothetical protein
LQRQFLDWAGKELKIKEFSDWYKVTYNDIIKMGGSYLLLTKFGNSPSLLLSTVYPEYDWLPWKFYKGPKNFWTDLKNQRKFLDWAGKQLNVKDFSDWYSVTHKVFLVFFIFFHLKRILSS